MIKAESGKKAKSRAGVSGFVLTANFEISRILTIWPESDKGILGVFFNGDFLAFST
jgi:hypothetical protein